VIRVAIVGTGGIAGICHVPALRAAADRAVIVAGMDVDAGRVNAGAWVLWSWTYTAAYHSMNGDQ
jgi:predicted dehydrogenase